MADDIVYASTDFLAALGAVAMNWAVIETALDFAVATSFHDLRNRKMEPEIPTSLGRKIRFLRQALCHDTLAPIRDDGKRLMKDLKARSDDRHGLVHGAVMGISDDGNTVQTLRVGYGKVRHTSTLATTTTDQVEEIANQAHGLSERATAFSIAVWNAAKPHDPIDYPLGEFAR